MSSWYLEMGQIFKGNNASSRSKQRCDEEASFTWTSAMTSLRFLFQSRTIDAKGISTPSSLCGHQKQTVRNTQPVRNGNGVIVVGSSCLDAGAKGRKHLTERAWHARGHFHTAEQATWAVAAGGLEPRNKTTVLFSDGECIGWQQLWNAWGGVLLNLTIFCPLSMGSGQNGCY